MDQIFERLERLVRAWVSSTIGGSPNANNSLHSGMFGDPDLADAWEELEQYLNPESAERAHRSKTHHQRPFSEQYDDSFRETFGQGSTYSHFHQTKDESTLKTEQHRQAVIEAYRFLGLEPFCPFSEVKSRYKELQKKHHPDRHASSPEDLKKANALSARINAAYQLIEAWEEAEQSHH